VQKRHELTDALAFVCGVKKSIELWNRSLQSAGKLSPAKADGADTLNGCDGELMDEKIGKVTRVLVVFESLLDMDCSLHTGFEHVCNGLVGKLTIDVGFPDTVVGCGRWVKLGERNRVYVTGADGELDLGFSIVDGDTANLHRSPSSSSSAMSSISLAVGLPLMGS
jgi:hypothetical protein